MPRAVTPGRGRAGEDLARLAREAGLQRATRRPGLAPYALQLWRRRAFAWSYATATLRAGNSRDLLGSLWLVLTPLLTGAIYFALFGLLLETSRGVENFLGFLVIGIFLFQYTSRTVSDGSRAVTGNRKLIQMLTFPAATLPLAVVMRQAVSGLVAVATMVVIVAATEAEVTWHWLLLVPVVALMTLFNAGLVLVLSRLTHHVRDVTGFLPFLLRGWLYVSGVFFSIDAFISNPALLRAFQANPMHAFFTLVREPLLYARAPEPWLWASAAGWALGLAALGFVVFWQGEESYGRD